MDGQLKEKIGKQQRRRRSIKSGFCDLWRGEAVLMDGWTNSDAGNCYIHRGDDETL